MFNIMKYARVMLHLAELRISLVYLDGINENTGFWEIKCWGISTVMSFLPNSMKISYTVRNLFWRIRTDADHGVKHLTSNSYKITNH